MNDPVRGKVRGVTARRILRYLGPHRGRVGVIGVGNIIQTLLSVAPVLIVKALVDDIQGPHASLGQLALLVAAWGGLVVIGGLVGVLTDCLTLAVKTTVMAEVRRDLTDRLLGQSVAYYTERRGGELMSRVLGDVAATDAMFDSAVSTATNAVTVVICVGAMLFLEWHLAVLTLAIVPLSMVILRGARRPIYRTRKQLQERLAALTAQMQESLGLSGIMLIKSFGREKAERERIGGLNDRLQKSQLAAGVTARWFSFLLGLLQFVAPAALLLTGAWLILHRETTFGTVTAFVAVLGVRFAVAVAGLGGGVMAVMGAMPAWHRIFELMDSPVDIRERPGALELENAAGALRLEAVTFTYSGRDRPAVQDVSLDVAPGQLVALVGPSGAGKSTLCSLVARFYDPQHGAVRIDGHDVRDLTLASLGRVAGLVLQETYLFHGTLRENLLYARPDATPSDLEEACASAQLNDVVAALPSGLDTVVGERGHRLSGGEKQRVAIARVILKDPRLLILDEATSHLDTISEQRVQLALTRLFTARTSLVIAHRLSTVLAADMIVVLDQGRIVGQGTHAELVETDGLYRSLYETQFRPDRSPATPVSIVGR